MFPQVLNYVHRHAAAAAAPCRLVLGDFLLFDRQLGLYSSLHLEGMTRISFYHIVVFLPDLCLVGWIYWQASMPHYPSPSKCSPGCREATGKHSIVCRGLGLLLHHGVCKKTGWKSGESGLEGVGDTIMTNPLPQWDRARLTD